MLALIRTRFGPRGTTRRLSLSALALVLAAPAAVATIIHATLLASSVLAAPTKVPPVALGPMTLLGDGSPPTAYEFFRQTGSSWKGDIAGFVPGVVYSLVIQGIDVTGVTGPANRDVYFNLQDAESGSSFKNLGVTAHLDAPGAGGGTLLQCYQTFTPEGLSSHGLNPGVLTPSDFDLRFDFTKAGAGMPWVVTPYFRLSAGSWTLFFDGSFTGTVPFDFLGGKLVVAFDDGADGTVSFDNYYLAGPASNTWVDDDWAGMDVGDAVFAGGAYRTIGVDAFDTVQEGVDAVVGSTVNIGPGTYEGQVVITTNNLTLQGSGIGTTILKSPVTLTSYFTTPGPYNNYPIVFVNGATGVTIRDLTVDGFDRGNGNYRFIGIAYWNSGGLVDDVEVKRIEDTPFSGAQHGVAVYANNNTGGPYSLEVGPATITDFQKNGTVFAGTALTVDVHDCTVTGIGPTAITAQNGIQIGGAASGTVSNVAISGVEYTPATWTACGLLIYGGGPVNVSGTNTLTGCQTGIYYEETNGTASGCNVTGSTWAALVYNYDISKASRPERGVAGERPTAAPFDVGAAEKAGNRTEAAYSVTLSDGCLLGSDVSGSSGVYAWSAGGALTVGLTDLEIQNWDYGVVADGAAVSVTANDNAITSNVTAGFDNTLSLAAQDAESNWWGAASGPGGVGPGTGDAVLGANVDFSPWLITGTDTNPGCGFTPGPDNVVTPVPPGTCISTAHPCVTVAVDIARTTSDHVRGFSVDLTLSTNLMLCSGLGSITQGTYLSSIGGTNFQVLDNGGGSYTVDCAILGLPCGATAASGNLFNVAVKNSGGDGTGTVTVASVTLRDCDNGPVAASAGPPASITIDNTLPVAVTNLTATQVKTGNDGDGTTMIGITFTAPPDATVTEVYRAPYGNYPEYDDSPNAGSVPPTPSYPPGAPWSLTDVTASGQTDELGPVMLGSSHLRVKGTWSGLNWDEPETNYAYRLGGTAVGKNNHNVPPGPPTGFPTGTMDPNLATIEYVRLPLGGTITIEGSFVTPLASANFATAYGQYLTVGLINKPWIDYATLTFGYNSGMFNTPSAGVNGNAYLLFFTDGSGSVVVAMEDRNSGNVGSPDIRLVPSVTSFSIQFQDGLDMTGAVVATGGRMRYALDGGAYGPWDNNSHDFRLLTALQLGAYTVDGGVLDATFADVTASIRDFWHYVMFTKDACGNVSPVSNKTGGTLNYHLGDVTNSIHNGDGNNLVNTPDVSLLGAHYGATLVASDPFGYLDVGPTTNYSVNARPTTDNQVQFEDLMMFAINYGQVSKAIVVAAPAASDELQVLAPDGVEPGGEVVARLWARGTGRIQGLSIRLAWNDQVVQPIGVEPGELLRQLDGVAFSPEPGVVDAALLGVRDVGLAGEGELARVRFRVLGAGDPGIQLAAVRARDAENQPVELDVHAGGTGPQAGVPRVTALLPNVPNPFNPTTRLAFTLAARGQVELSIYTVAGRQVRTLVRDVREPGFYEVTWDGAGENGQRLSSGVYYARLVTEDVARSRALMLVK